ncbi:MAG: glutathione S-transferase family protein [Cyanobacteria bacterium P01_C01_bin.72]
MLNKESSEEAMGKLIDGKWVETSIVTSDTSGRYDRQPRTFRDAISADDPVFKPETDRYHLYVGYACPWATRTLIYRTLKGLEEHISVSVVHPDMLDKGWSFDADFPGATGDNLYGLTYLHELYQKAQNDVTTSVTVPVLWDKKTSQIVNNESSEIIRIFNTGFNSLTGNTEDYYPEKLRAEIDEWNEEIYHNVNNGVYRSGFAKTQGAYDEAVTGLFETLDKLDAHLEGKDYLLGDRLTEADLRLIPTLLRFDLVYYVHFKTNIRRIMEYPNLSRYTANLYAMDAISKNHNFEHIKRHYYYSHKSINPYRIVPKGPVTFIKTENQS